MLFRSEFEGGVKVSGEIITGRRNLQGKIILISFKNCTVTHRDTYLFKPEWGIYDMAVGASITSAFAGVADAESFGLISEPPKEKTHKIKYTEADKKVHQLYEKVRSFRQSKFDNFEKLRIIFNQLQKNNPEEWLLFLELYEILKPNKNELKQTILTHLKVLQSQKDYQKLISEGLDLLN